MQKELKIVIAILVLAGCLNGQTVIGAKAVMGGQAVAGTNPAGSVGPIDALLDMNTSTPGTALTTTILNSGTQGLNNTGQWGSTSLTPFTVAPHKAPCAMYGTVMVNGALVAINHTSQSIAFNHTSSTFTGDLSIPLATGPAGFTQVTVSGCMIVGPASVAAGSAVLFDFHYLRISAGGYSTMQLNNGNCGGAGTYALNIEADPGGVTTHSACIILTPQEAILYSFQMDSAAGLASLKVQDASSLSVLGSVTQATRTGIIDLYRIGNNEAGTSSGNFSYFENTYLKYTGGSIFPMGPITSIQPGVYLISKSPNTSVLSGSSTTTASTAIALPAGITNLVWVSMENAAATVSGCADTAGNTYTQVTTVNLATQGHGEMWVAKNTTANAANVVTCTHTASTFRNIFPLALGGASLTAPVDVSAVGTAATGVANVTTGTLTPTTSTGSVVACGYITAGVALIQDTNYQLVNTSSTLSTACEFRPSAPASSQTATLTQSNTASKWMIAVALKK